MEPYFLFSLFYTQLVYLGTLSKNYMPIRYTLYSYQILYYDTWLKSPTFLQLQLMEHQNKL